VPDVVVVGGGVAGIVCASDLAAAGVDCILVEASDGLGGRVRTDQVDGFLLDRGFQILLLAYPQVIERLDLDALALGLFEPGAVIRRNGAFHRVADPLRRPRLLWSTVTAPIGTVADKLRLARLVFDVRRGSVPTLLRRPDGTTAARLARAGFSELMIEAFWRPLFSGIQLDPDLEVSRRRFDTILRMLATGGTGIPHDGFGAIPTQLAMRLPTGAVRLNARVTEVGARSVTLRGGERIDCRDVVVATDGPTAHTLLGTRVADPGSRPVACCWFATREAPPVGRFLVLDGEQSGAAKNVAVMSNVARSYAPPGLSSVAAAVPGRSALVPGIASRVREQLARWFDGMTSDWQLLRVDVIAHGQPLQRPPLHARQRVSLGDGVFVCGDHRDTASLQGAMFSGERTAAAVLRDLRGAAAA
jgi:phytoene dehydrogenase-like protein